MMKEESRPMVNIQVQAFGGIWQTITSVEANNAVGITYRLDEAFRTYKKRCRAIDAKTGTVVDMRM